MAKSYVCKLCMEIISLAMSLNQKQSSGTEDINTQLCNISEQRHVNESQPSCLSMWKTTQLGMICSTVGLLRRTGSRQMFMNKSFFK